MPTSSLEYFQAVRSQFIAFQAGTIEKIPPVPPENCKNALMIYNRARLSAAESFSQQFEGGVPIEYGVFFGSINPNDGTKVIEPYYYTGKDGYEHQESQFPILDTNRDGKLHYEHFGGDKTKIYSTASNWGGEGDNYEYAIATATAVDNVLSQYKRGERATELQATPDRETAKTKLIQQHGEEAYKKGGFTHVYGGITTRLSEAAGASIELPTLEPGFVKALEIAKSPWAPIPADAQKADSMPIGKPPKTR
jgi:hypothetical protein